MRCGCSAVDVFPPHCAKTANLLCTPCKLKSTLTTEKVTFLSTSSLFSHISSWTLSVFSPACIFYVTVRQMEKVREAVGELISLYLASSVILAATCFSVFPLNLFWWRLFLSLKIFLTVRDSDVNVPCQQLVNE